MSAGLGTVGTNIHFSSTVDHFKALYQTVHIQRPRLTDSALDPNRAVVSGIAGQSEALETPPGFHVTA